MSGAESQRFGFLVSYRSLASPGSLVTATLVIAPNAGALEVMAEQLFKFNLLAGQITRRERGRWVASMVSLPRVAVGTTIGRGVRVRSGIKLLVN